MAKHWERAGVIAGVLSSLVAIVALIASIVVPEVRCYFGLKSEVCSSVQTPTTPQDPSNGLAIAKDYSIQIFFLRGRDDLQKEAAHIQRGLIERGFNSEKVMLEPVSDLQLQNLEFPRGNEVRFDVGYEEIPAESIRQLLGEVFPSKTFSLRDANNPKPTKGSISIFLLP